MFNTTGVFDMNKIYMYTNERERERGGGRGNV